MAAKKTAAVTASWPKPDFGDTVKTSKNFRRNFHGAMLYVHYEITATELKREVTKYLKSIDAKHRLLDRIKDMNENRFATVGKYIYLLNHGCDIPDDVLPKLMSALEKIIHEDEEKTASEEKKSQHIKAVSSDKGVLGTVVKIPVSIQDRLREKSSEVSGEVEGWLDDCYINQALPAKTVEEFVNLFKSFDLKAPHTRYIQNTFEHRAKEISELLLGKDPELVEGYSNFSKASVKKFDLFYKNLFKACGMMQEAAKVERAPQKKKLVSVDKVVSKLKYKKEDKVLGLVSLNPANIVGAKEIWIYNTKTRKLAQIKAADAGGLQVKGASVLNYSPDSAEKTLRKPAEALADFKKASKVKLRTFLKELTTIDIPCNGKLNEHDIILRIDK